MKKEQPLVYIIVLNFNGSTDTLECIERLKQIEYRNYVIVIVDNNSTDNSKDIFHEGSGDYVFLQTMRNFGYAGGNNVGIRYAIKNNADYICILNNDVWVEEDYLSELVEYLENNQNAAMVGPMICEYHKSNIIQSTGANIDFLKGQINIINRLKNVDDIHDKIIRCDYIGGACMLVRRSVIDKIGLIPENYFLFYEETEWCLKAKKEGYEIVCDCNSKVRHKGSVSIDKVPGLSEYFIHRNRVVFQKRNASFTQFIRFILYLFTHTIYRIITRKENVRIAKFYIDGLLNRVDRKYSYCYIAQNEMKKEL